jgi:hypothetical protein
MSRSMIKLHPPVALLLISMLGCTEPQRPVAPVKNAPVPPDAPQAAAFDSIAALPAGRTVLVDRGRLRLTLAGITGDSRCPKGVQCVWAGTVSGRIDVTVATGAQVSWNFEVYDASLAPNGEFTTPNAIGPYRLRVQRVEPYPIAGTPTPPADYVAQVRVTRAAW